MRSGGEGSRARPPWSCTLAAASSSPVHPGVELRANLNSIFHRCHLFEMACVLELTEETIHLPLGCLQGGTGPKFRRSLSLKHTSVYEPQPHQVPAGLARSLKASPDTCRIKHPATLFCTPAPPTSARGDLDLSFSSQATVLSTATFEELTFGAPHSKSPMA